MHTLIGKSKTNVLDKGLETAKQAEGMWMSRNNWLVYQPGLFFRGQRFNLRIVIEGISAAEHS
jgi:hypothetical protein